MFTDFYQSPIGMMEITATHRGIAGLYFKDKTTVAQPNPLTEKAKAQIGAYFLGQRDHFDLPLDFKGTIFQKSVWQALCDIPFGATCSYLDIASKLDNRKAVRAVGAANGKNPVSIIVPCHRVIGSNGTLTGYAGGLDRKAWLLAHEAPHAQ